LQNKKGTLGIFNAVKNFSSDHDILLVTIVCLGDFKHFLQVISDNDLREELFSFCKYFETFAKLE
jgi:hypothetical protein